MLFNTHRLRFWEINNKSKWHTQTSTHRKSTEHSALYTAEASVKQPSKCQNHTTYVGVVGYESHGSSPTVCAGRWISIYCRSVLVNEGSYFQSSFLTAQAWRNERVSKDPISNTLHYRFWLTWKTRRMGRSKIPGMRNSTRSPIFSDLKSELSRVARFPTAGQVERKRCLRECCCNWKG